MKWSAYFAYLVVCVSGNLAWAVPAASQPTAASALQRVQSALTLSPKDELLLASLRDGTDPAEQNGFYRMMRIVADLPALSAEEFRQLDSPAWANLLREPGRYRFQPIRWPLRVYVVRERTVGKGLRTNPYWPEEKPIYEIHATHEDSADEPVILYAAAPPADLGKPSEPLPDGRMRYKTGPTYRLAGVFLQYETHPFTDSLQTDDAKRRYPVILAWQFELLKAPSGSPFGPFTQKEQLYTWGAVLLAIVVAVGMFVFVQRRLRRPSAARQGVTFKKYRPLRDEEPSEEKPEDDVPVDPDLSTAIEDYRRNHFPESKDTS